MQRRIKAESFFLLSEGFLAVAFHSTRQGCWYLGPMTTKEAFEPTFASELLEDCFIDHNKLFGLINVASRSLVFRNPVVN